MSHSPASTEGNESAYHKSWADIYELIEAGGSWSGREHNCCYLNTDNNRFTDISAVSGLDHIDDGRGVAAVDWDFDGDLDLWLANRTGPRIRFMRNDQRSGNHFLGVLLQGRTCNRDAIGARLELTLNGEPQRKLIQTVQAGDAFVSQSTKWKHFGLGDSTEIQQLVVRWPGGAVERFETLQPDHFYRIVQGSGQAEIWEKPSRELNWAAAEPQKPVSTGSKTALVYRIPVPSLGYTDFDGRAQSLNPSEPQATLINLWATWCLPCVEELQQFAEHYPQLREIGLQVVALSVDGIRDAADPSASAAPQSTGAAVRKFIEKLKVPFATGEATLELVDKLDVLQDAVHAYGVEFDQSMTFPIPTSFLVDASGRLAVIYKGQVKVQDLLADVAGLQAPLDEIRSAAVPFPGRWYEEPADVTNVMVRFAERFIRRGYFDDGRAYLALAADLWDQQSDHFNLRNRLVFMYTYVGDSLVEQSRDSDALHCYHEALRLDPDAVQTHVQLGGYHFQRGQLDEAAEHYGQAKRIRPQLLEASLNLGMIALQQRRLADAVSHLQDCLQIDSGLAPAHNLLGLALANQGDTAGARQHFSEAVRLDPNYIDARRNLQLLESSPGRGF